MTVWFVATGAESGKRYCKTNSRARVVKRARDAANANDEEIIITAVDESSEEEQQGPGVRIGQGNASVLEHD